VPVPVLVVVSVADVSVVVSVTLTVPEESALSEELESTPVIESLIDPTVTVASELDSPLGSIVTDEEPSPVAVIEFVSWMSSPQATATSSGRASQSLDVFIDRNSPGRAVVRKQTP